MPAQLKLSIGQYSDKGRKEINQDFHACMVPNGPRLNAKGIVVALADGISSSSVSAVASQSSVKGFIDDYYSTSEAWSVKKAGCQVLLATNSWLYSQTQQSPFRYEREKGYVCAFSAVVFKATTAHLFHVGDTRIYRLRGNGWEQLTHDHRISVSQDESHLSRALGSEARVDVDCQSLGLQKGDAFLLATDGVYEFVDAQLVIDAIAEFAGNLDEAARKIVDAALAAGSEDNLTAQVVRIDELPEQGSNDIVKALTELPLPPLLESRMPFDGYTIVREIHASSRSHVYLAIDDASKKQAIIKIPSIDKAGDPEYLERFLMEDWIARRVNSAYVLKPLNQ
ncbi:MAG TPA: protein phosphatase 2C domain-containing protein, partial [Steroidobacteraceae bacterium]|nr:protein phosphatase 2C domain-containing protein [Steroidobacteraceae bacterium]